MKNNKILHILIMLIIIFLLWGCHQNSHKKDVVEKCINQPEQTELQTNQFQYIEKQKGDFKVRIEWPLNILGISDIKPLQKSIIKNIDFNNNLDTNKINIIASIDKFLADCNDMNAPGSNGELYVTYQGKFKDYTAYKIFQFCDWGGDTGASVVENNFYLYFNDKLQRPLSINDIFINDKTALNCVNEYISLDEYACKATKIPNNFKLFWDKIIIIFPKYSIGYGYQGECEISLNYNDVKSSLSKDFKEAMKIY